MSLQLLRLPHRDDLIEQVRHAWQMVEAGQFDEALEAARAVEAACAAANVESPHVCWVATVAADRAGKLLTALRYVLKAIRLDPVMAPAEHSLAIVAGRCRKALVEGSLEADEGMALYQVLAENCLADDACRLSYAQHLHDYSRHEEALQVAQAVAVLNPSMGDAWRLVGAAATALGRMDLAAEASARCNLARTDDGWNSVPRGAWGRA